MPPTRWMTTPGLKNSVHPEVESCVEFHCVPIAPVLTAAANVESERDESPPKENE